MHVICIALAIFVTLSFFFPRENDMHYKQRCYIDYNVPPTSHIWKFLSKDNKITFNIPFDKYDASTVTLDCFPPFNVTWNGRPYKYEYLMPLLQNMKLDSDSEIILVEKTKMSKNLFVDLEYELTNTPTNKYIISLSIQLLLSALKDVLKLSIEYEKSKEFQPKIDH